jgi:hypothetical protein
MAIIRSSRSALLMSPVSSAAACSSASRAGTVRLRQVVAVLPARRASAERTSARVRAQTPGLRHQGDEASLLVPYGQ